MGDSEHGVMDAPTWDFSGVSRAWQKAFSKTMRDASKAQLTLARPAPEGDSVAVNAHIDAQEAALDDLERIGEEQQALIAQVLVDVPADWVVAGAPNPLDFSDADALDWIKPDRWAELLMAVQTGEAWSDAAKNSAGGTS
jgi:hypothetical protein